MIVTVWLSGENEPLARAELAAAAERLGGRVAESREPDQVAGRGQVELRDRQAGVELAGRLGLAHRCAEEWSASTLEELENRLGQAGASGETAAVQWVSGSLGERPRDLLRRLGGAYVSGGGRIALENPDHRFWLEPFPVGAVRFYEELGSVRHASFSERRTPRLPFQRPVTLAPRLARALVNLAHVGAHDRVVDPLVGTGSLLLEAALLGARTVGIDMSATMVRGALENFAHFGLTPETLRQADAAEAALEFPPGSFDALVTDPPYGRASGTRGEPPDRLWHRT
ncbi:MAG: methyltransferase domain-containing protein, partial [Thermoplasmata archaeon]|nr:methyltransferase domain-containing protein [Thermoplasmata archaeon]